MFQTKGVIAYEGLIFKSSYSKYETLKGPVAQGDGPLWLPGKNPEESQFSVYGSAHAGIFGSIIRQTNVPSVLQLDLLATDFYHEKAYPSYLYYNSFPTSQTVIIELKSKGKVDLYNTVSGSFTPKRFQVRLK